MLEALSGHGVRPTSTTRPALVHEFVSDLYRYEIRRLRGIMRHESLSKTQYARRIIDLRLKYRVISMRPQQWVEPAAPILDTEFTADRAEDPLR